MINVVAQIQGSWATVTRERERESERVGNQPHKLKTNVNKYYVIKFVYIIIKRGRSDSDTAAYEQRQCVHINAYEDLNRKQKTIYVNYKSMGVCACVFKVELRT